MCLVPLENLHLELAWILLLHVTWRSGEGGGGGDLSSWSLGLRSLEEIFSKLDSANVPYEEAKVRKMVEDVERRRAAPGASDDKLLELFNKEVRGISGRHTVQSASSCRTVAPPGVHRRASPCFDCGGGGGGVGARRRQQPTRQGR